MLNLVWYVTAAMLTFALNTVAICFDFFTHCLNQCRVKMGALGPLEIGPRTRKRKVFSILVVISLVGTIWVSSFRLLPPDVIF